MANESYEERCTRLAERFADDLVKVDDSRKLDLSDLKTVSDRIQAEVSLADYKSKYRQADHIKWFSWVPIVLSIATFALTVTLLIVNVRQTQGKEQEQKASFVLKVLDAPPSERQNLLTFLTDAKLLKLSPAEQTQLNELVQKK